MYKYLYLPIILAAIFASNVKATLITTPGQYFNDLITSGNTLQLNTNVWQLGFLNSTNGNFTLFNYSTGDVNFDYYNSATFYGFRVNTSGTNRTLYHGVISPDELYGHAANSNAGDIILRFMAPETANFTFNTTITSIDFKAGLGKVLATVKNMNNAVLKSKVIQYGSNLPSSLNYNAALQLTKNDFIDFSVNRSNDTWNYDSVKFAANVVSSSQPVPEPSTLAIFALGIMGLASRRFKK